MGSPRFPPSHRPQRWRNLSEGKLVGLVSAAEVRGVPPAEWRTTTVGKVMRTDPAPRRGRPKSR